MVFRVVPLLVQVRIEHPAERGVSAGTSRGEDRRAVGRPAPLPGRTRAAPRAQVESRRVRRIRPVGGRARWGNARWGNARWGNPALPRQASIYSCEAFPQRTAWLGLPTLSVHTAFHCSPSHSSTSCRKCGPVQVVWSTGEHRAAGAQEHWSRPSRRPGPK